LERIHAAQGHSYPFPDLEKFVGVVVAVDENDVPVQAIAARPTVELYLIGDPNWRTPKWRLLVVEALFHRITDVLRSLGYTDCHAWLPPSVERAFGRRMERDFGWLRSRWKSFCFYLS